MGSKKRYAALLLAAALGLTVSACGAEEETDPASNPGSSTAQAQPDASPEQNDGASDSSDASGTPAEGGDGILIAYFTAAENSGVDAEASASYSEVDGEAKGRMQALAEMIQAETGGDLFSIQTEETYPADGGELIDYAAEEQDEDARPELGSRFSGTIDTIAELEPDAEVIEDGFTVNERDVPDAAGDIADWLEGLGY